MADENIERSTAGFRFTPSSATQDPKMKPLLSTSALRLAITAVLALLILLTGCSSSNPSSKVYTRDEAKRSYKVELGTIEAINSVTLEGNRSGIGATAGGAVGAIGGSTVGEGKGSQAASVLAGLLGGLFGDAVEERTTRKEGAELVVRLESGQTIVVVQEADQPFTVGQRVRLVKQPGGETRVTPLEQPAAPSAEAE